MPLNAFECLWMPLNAFECLWMPLNTFESVWHWHYVFPVCCVMFSYDKSQSKIVSGFLTMLRSWISSFHFSELRQVLSKTTFKKAKISQFKKRIHLFNYDNTYKLEPVEKLLEKCGIHVKRVEKHYFRLPKMFEMVDMTPTLEMDRVFSWFMHMNVYSPLDKRGRRGIWLRQNIPGFKRSNG